jgi:peroxin-19
MNSDPNFAETLEQTLAALSGEGDKAAFNNMMNPLAGKSTPASDLLDADIVKTLQNLSEGSKGMEGMDPVAAEAMGEEVMKKIMEDFEKMGEKEDFQKVIDGMMHQLLSKDVMFTPMSLICEKYPEWLADNEDSLSKEDYTRYGKQYQYFQQIVALYETEPDNYPRLLELFQDMQETGQPPAEIVKELAPGLEFGKDGMPVMAGMNAGAFPGIPSGMPGTEGLPEGCVVM